MDIKKIYFDMDGVLADFDRGVRELCGLESVPQDRERPGKDDAMWAAIRETGHFYDRLELMPGAKKMFDTVYGKYGERCEILTGIPKPRRGITTAGEDKISWVVPGYRCKYRIQGTEARILHGKRLHPDR